MTKTKLKKEFQLDEEDNTVVVPVESIPEVAVTTLKKQVKREMSEKQRENMNKLIQANKEKWNKLRQEKENAKKEAEAKLKQETEEKLQAGTHVKLKLKEKQIKPRKTQPVKKIPNEVYSDDDEETTDFTETDDDTDYEEYKSKKRNVRREVKKNIKALQKIDEVLTTNNQNPYLASLMNRWK